MTAKKQTLIRLGIYLLIAFSLTWIPDLICLKIFGYEKWLNSPYGVILTMTMFSPMLGNFLTRLITKEGMEDHKLHLNLKGNLRYYFFGMLLTVMIGVIVSAICNFTHGNWKFEAAADISSVEIFTTFMGMCIAPIFYSCSACFGEEFGWRGYLNPKLEQLTGTAGAVIIGGIIWGLWHAELIMHGYNFGSEHPLLGVALMCVSCIFVNAILMWLTKKTDSVYPAVITHAALDMPIATFIMQLMISGISPETESRITTLQSGIIYMVIPEVIIGTVCLVQLLRDKNKTAEKV